MKNLSVASNNKKKMTHKYVFAANSYGFWWMDGVIDYGIALKLVGCVSEIKKYILIKSANINFN